MKTAIVLAAGWKGAGCRKVDVPNCQDCLKPLATCPEPLLPLGDGSTSLSRLSRQFRELDFEVIIAVGKLGCLYPRYAGDAGGRSISRVLAHQMLRESPWTKGRLQFAAEYGNLVTIDEPDGGTRFNSACCSIEACLQRGPVSRLFIVHGDFLFSDRLFREIVNLPFPFYLHLFGGEEVFFLDEGGIQIYHRIAPRERLSENYFESKRAMIKPRRLLCETLALAGVNLLNVKSLTYGREWQDLDTWRAYNRALGRVKQGFEEQI